MHMLLLNLEALKVNDDNKKHTYMYRRAWKTFIALQSPKDLFAQEENLRQIHKIMGKIIYYGTRCVFRESNAT